MLMTRISLFSLALFGSLGAQEEPLEIATYSSEEITPILPLLQDWVEREFLKYPYLWVAPKGTIYTPNERLMEDERGLAAVVKRENEVVAVFCCIPFDSVALEPSLQPLLSTVKEKWFDPSRMLYIPYFLSLEDIRNDERAIYSIYQHLLEHAKQTGCHQICVMEALGQPNHLLRPDSFIALEPWGKLGFEKMDIELEITWPTLQVDGSICEEAHTMVFLYKNI